LEIGTWYLGKCEACIVLMSAVRWLGTPPGIDADERGSEQVHHKIGIGNRIHAGSVRDLKDCR